MATFIDLTGQVFGFWRVKSRSANSRHGMARWNVICICGRKQIVSGARLRAGGSLSCGKHTTGERNNNWKGGRSLASNGYVLVRVGQGHPLADCRGYAYEHRLVAEQEVGRPLSRTDQVHHADEDKQNNQPRNLQVKRSTAEHLREHRRYERGLREPGEPNPIIECACGCGARFVKFDKSGRPRRFVSGHNLGGLR